MTNEINGLTIGLLNLFIALSLGYLARHIKCSKKQLHNISFISYYWQIITITTFIWEICYISQFKRTSEMAKTLIINKEHVWLKEYPLYYILPNNMAVIFYAEYASYADREYMDGKNDWSQVVEGTHMLFCGIVTLFSLLSKLFNYNRTYIILISAAMGAQLMNSIMYMANYIIETKDPNNINYCGDWNCGTLYDKRPFMYVNLFWTIMPIVVLTELIIQFAYKNKITWDGRLFSSFYKYKKSYENCNISSINDDVNKINYFNNYDSDEEIIDSNNTLYLDLIDTIDTINTYDEIGNTTM